MEWLHDVGHILWIWLTLPELLREVARGLIVLLFSYVFVRLVEVICRIRRKK